MGRGAVILIAALTPLVGCNTPAGVGADASATSSTSAAATAAAPSTPTRRGEMTCQFTGDGGTYYLVVTSLLEFDLSECDGGVPVEGRVEALFALGGGMDRRCIYDMTTDPSVHAIVGVYSSSAKPDLDAALGRCLAHSAHDY